MKKPSPLLTASQLGRALGVTSARVCQLRQLGMPSITIGGAPRFNPEECIPWFMAQSRSRNGNGHAGAPTVSEFDAARSRKIAADAALAELRLAVKRRELVPIPDVIRVVTEHVSAARARLLDMGAALGPVLAAEDTPAGCQRVVDAGIREALAELAGTGFDQEVIGHVNYSVA